MFARKLKTALVATAGVSALFMGLASPAAADPILLNPGGSNGLAACPGGGSNTPCTISPGFGPSFLTTEGSFAFTSDLQVQSTVNFSSVLNSVANVEIGSLVFFDWGLGNQQGLTTKYNIYGTFRISGLGHWDGAGTYLQDSLTTFSLELWANPGTGASIPAGTTPTFTQAKFTNAAQTTADGLTAPGKGVNDFKLADAYVKDFAGKPSAFFGTTPTETLVAALGLLPRAGTTGTPDGFWENLLPSGLNLTVGASNSSNGVAITKNLLQAATGLAIDDFCPLTAGGGFCSDLQTHGNFGPLFGGTSSPSHGNGTVTFDVFGVPEPTTLGMFGFGLLGLGFMVRRNNKKASKA